MYREVKGDLFAVGADALINTINTRGAMGRGIALQFKQRYPQMYRQYRLLCQRRGILPGTCWPWAEGRSPGGLVLNCAIKDDWRQPARMEWIESSIKAAIDLITAYNEEHPGMIQKVAFPHMGAQNGWLPWPPIYALMQRYLRPLGERLEVTLVEYGNG